MGPRKRQQSGLAGPRKSARLAARLTSLTPEHARGLSVMTAHTESSDTWRFLAEASKARIAKYQPQNRVHEERLRPFLNAFVEWLPEGGRESVARDIINATIDENLYDVFHNLFTGFALLIKAHFKQSTVTAPPYPKIQENVDVVAVTTDEPQNRDLSFQDICLQRDSYRCVATSEMDYDYWKKLGSPEDIGHSSPEAAHIIPFAYSSWDKSSEPPSDAASAWELLSRCFPHIRKTRMQVEDMNDLSNGITLQYYVRWELGKFSLAFKPTNRVDVYEPRVFKRYPTMARQSILKNIKFTRAEDTQDQELPDAALLDCHYRLAEILNATDMAGIIQKYYRDWEDIKHSAGRSLKEDGKSDIGQLLGVALWERVVG